jgi:hypothetical protein
MIFINGTNMPMEVIEKIIDRNMDIKYHTIEAL